MYDTAIGNVLRKTSNSVYRFRVDGVYIYYNIHSFILHAFVNIIIY
jgi:hypothetical protein